MKKIFLFLVIYFFLGCQSNIPQEKYCESDADCAAATCCHPDSCVNMENKPGCGEIMCTLDCKPDTMDCGQGRCVCQNNECIAEIS